MAYFAFKPNLFNQLHCIYVYATLLNLQQGTFMFLKHYIVKHVIYIIHILL